MLVIVSLLSAATVALLMVPVGTVALSEGNAIPPVSI